MYVHAPLPRITAIEATGTTVIVTVVTALASTVVMIVTSVVLYVYVDFFFGCSHFCLDKRAIAKMADPRCQARFFQ